MEWLIMPSNSLRVTASKMGYMKDEVYIIGDECQAALEELLHNLQHEDTVSRSLRREIASSTLVECDLFPILNAAVNDASISYLVIQVLSNLTLPMAVIMPVKHQMTPQDWAKRRGVQHMESAIKSLCADAQITNILVNHIKNNIKKAGKVTMQKTNLGMILEIIAFIRNVLHADDIRPGSTNGDTIISNLLDAGFDDAVVDLLAMDEGAVWVPNLTQVLGLMFRSQKSSELLQLLNTDNKADKEDNKSTLQSDGSDKKEATDKDEEGPKLPGVNGYEDDPVMEDKTYENKSQQNVPKIQVEPSSDEAGDNYRELDLSSEASDPKSVSSESGSVLSEGSSISPLCEALQNGAQVIASDNSKVGVLHPQTISMTIHLQAHAVWGVEVVHVVVWAVEVPQAP
ncbi:protein timeless-like isoform X1 [Amphiura filiformis]|uniref:protein timeless-like isoform X1 n=1 Tax=Amphiura filiformis TaxID=82378 RepID=UPI003B217E9D